MSCQTPGYPALTRLPWLGVPLGGCLRSFFRLSISTCRGCIRRERAMFTLWGWLYLRLLFSISKSSIRVSHKLFKVLTGAQPFTEMKRNQNVTIHVVNGKRPSRPVNSESLGISDPLWATLWSCWIADPTRRPGVEAVRKLLQQEIPTWDLRPSIQAPSQPDLDVQSETSTSSFRGTTRSRSVDERSVSSARSVSAIITILVSINLIVL
jgi:hypothetical protein